MTIDAAFTQFPCLTTERLVLRRLQIEDAPALFSIYSDEESMRYFGNNPQQSLSDTEALIRRLQALYASRRSIRWGVAFKDSDTLIGTCSLHHFDEGYHCVQTGYDLNRTHWGKGIMTEAMLTVLNFGFTDLGVHRIEAIIDIENERSRKLLLRLGFTYEGNLRQRYFERGIFEDEYYFGLLEDEWLANHFVD
ncbi:MAG TPA: GNAT family protein [Ktedonobacteraceae bacterium]|nr:GNAT family protein [Ktedonobacteraceae bacterium]